MEFLKIKTTGKIISGFVLLSVSGASVLAVNTDERVIELDPFYATANDSDHVGPMDWVSSSVFLFDEKLLNTPRSITVLSKETMEKLHIQDFEDLSRFGAGTERYNFYGIAGAPVIRGWEAGIFFNGMLRAHQRNEMPTSFGSLESLEVIKGVAPAQFLPTHVGGYVNMIPKSPYYDKSRGSLGLEVGSYGHYRAQLDYGAPVKIAGKSAAYRISITGQQADSYYDHLSNDYVSVYGAIKMQVTDRTRLFVGGEYYAFQTNENAGWNRPTQNLIDNGAYVIGEPLSLVRSGNSGVADRDLFRKAGADFRALVVPANVIDGALTAGEITSAQVGLLKDMSDPMVRSETYAVLTSDANTVIQTDSGFLYTPDYFAAGGKVFTTPIEGSTVLSDPNDFANSVDGMFFLDLTTNLESGIRLENKFFAEKMDTDKESSYGYAFKSEQTVVNYRLSVSDRVDLHSAVNVAWLIGGEVRYTEAEQLQDFFAEPYGRRDISSDTISANSKILVGEQKNAPGDADHWGTRLGANAVDSDLLQSAVFAVAELEISSFFEIIGSIRAEDDLYDTKVPDSVTSIAPTSNRSDISFINYSLNPTIRISGNLSIYGVLQEATTYIPAQGGPVVNDANFGDGELLEGGIKLQVLEDRLFVTLAYYEWDQSSFSEREAISTQYQSEGWEFEVTYEATNWLTLIGSISSRETTRESLLGYRTLPWGDADTTGSENPEIGLALDGGTLFTPPFGSAPYGVPANPDLVLPGAPEETIKCYALIDLSENYFMTVGLVYQSDYWLNFERTLHLDSTVVVQLGLGYETELWNIRLNVENLFEEDYFSGSDPYFSSNAIVTKAPGREFQLSVTRRF